MESEFETWLPAPALPPLTSPRPHSPLQKSVPTGKLNIWPLHAEKNAYVTGHQMGFVLFGKTTIARWYFNLFCIVTQ